MFSLKSWNEIVVPDEKLVVFQEHLKNALLGLSWERSVLVSNVFTWKSWREIGSSRCEASFLQEHLKNALPGLS